MLHAISTGQIWPFSWWVACDKEVDMSNLRWPLVPAALVSCLCSAFAAPPAPPEEHKEAPKKTVRVGSVEPQNRTLDYRLEPAEALAQVEKSLDELEKLVHKAGEAGCNVVAFPEDTLGLGKWEAGNPEARKEVLPKAAERMLDRLGRTAAKHRMYLVCANDILDGDGELRNTAFFVGPDGKEIGRYFKVQPVIHEASKRGDKFPVFPTSELGGVGLLICYDMVFPEAPRCLALGGADIIFHPTLGGAAIGDDDISRAAFRTRAVENFVYIVVSQRGSGSMIISPQGKILAEGKGPDDIAIADIDPFGGREGGDAFNHQQDMRARLFRERNPAAYGLLTDPDPPVLKKIAAICTPAEATRIAGKAITVGEEEFRGADLLERAGKTPEAVAAFEKLRSEYRGTWIERVAEERLLKFRSPLEEERGSRPEEPAAVAAKYPGDRGIEEDPAVLFVEGFEESSLEAVWKRWDNVGGGKIMSFSADVPPRSAGRQSLAMDRHDGSGGALYRRIKNKAGGWGCDQLFVRFYVKFAPDCGELHHGVSAVGGNNPPTPWPAVSAGNRPDGAKSFWSGIEPYGDSWAWDYYTYWCEMRGSPPRGQTWGNSFIRDPNLKVEKGKWICVEHMMKVNDMGDTNGEQALWIDGKPVSRLGKGFPKGGWIFDKFTPGKSGTGIRWSDAKGDREEFQVPAGGAPYDGFRWRTDPELNLNFVWLYVYTQKPAGHRMQVWFDDLVVATQYVGPLQRARN
jgi:predicted amidohydrolase